MKRIIFLISICFVVLLASGAYASPFYLTMTGKVSSITNWYGVPSASRVNIGDTLSYVVKIDKGLMGSSTSYDSKSYRPFSYFAELVSGHLYEHTGSYMNPTNNYVYENNVLSTLNAGNKFSNIDAANMFRDFDNYKVGASFDQFMESTYKNGFEAARICLDDVKIASVSNTAPTPVPAAILLFSSGLCALGFLRRKFA